MIEAPIQDQWRPREWLGPVAVAVAAVVCLPLLGFLVFAARSALPAAIGALGVLIVLRVVFHKPIGEWFAMRRAARETYRGVRLHEDVALDPGHTWAWLADEVVVGADDLVPKVLGPIDQVDLPAEGRHVERGQPLFSVRHGERRIDLNAPVSGTVVGINTALREHPELINANPFEQGWVVRIRSENLPEDRRHLLIGRKAWTWFREEVDFLFRTLPAGDASDLYRRIDDSAWSALVRSLGARRVA